MLKVIKYTLLSFLLFVLSGCHSLHTSVVLKAREGINPDTQGEALPVVVRVYALKDIAAFKEASFNELWQTDKPVLGGALISRQSWIVTPGSQVTVQIPWDKDTKYIAAVAIFRKHSNQHWKAWKRFGYPFIGWLKPSYITLQQNQIHIR